MHFVHWVARDFGLKWFYNKKSKLCFNPICCEFGKSNLYLEALSFCLCKLPYAQFKTEVDICHKRDGRGKEYLSISDYVLYTWEGKPQWHQTQKCHVLMFPYETFSVSHIRDCHISQENTFNHQTKGRS